MEGPRRDEEDVVRLHDTVLRLHGRSLDERDARERARLGVSRHGLGHGEVNGSVVAAEYLGQLFGAERRLALGQHRRDLVPLRERETFDEPPHRAVTDQSQLHPLVPSAVNRVRARRA